MGGVAHLLEWVALSGLLYSLQDILVDPEAEGDSQDGQGEIGQHAQDRETGEWQKDKQHGAKDHSCLLHIPPVDQIQHCIKQGAIYRERACNKNQIEDLKNISLLFTCEYLYTRTMD